MTYAELSQNIKDLAEFNFSDDLVKLFVQQTEKLIYSVVQFPAIRKNVTGTLTANQQYLTLPVDFIWLHSLAVDDGAGGYQFLIDKDVNFIREAYPNSTVTGLPKHYGLFSDTSAIVGPTPDVSYNVEMHYGYFPESIVTAGTTWLGDTFDNALLNGAMIEAARFNKAEPDIIANYDKMFQASVLALKNLTEGRLRGDSYRSGQFRQPAN